MADLDDMNILSLLKQISFPEDDDPTFLLASSDAQGRVNAIVERKEGAEIAAAIEIQRMWRGYRARYKLKSILKFHPKLVAPLKKVKLSKIAAIKIIKSAWKSYQVMPEWDRKTFKCYLAIMNFHKKGDPMTLLRYINPLEAKLLDKSSGAIVRFRLGGDTFPPKIFYKIYTNNIVDVCSFSPRDYTAMCEKRMQAKDMHSNAPRWVPMDTASWYKRLENNGWRTVDHFRLYPKCVSDDRPVAPFHHLKYQRQEDVLRKRKQRKIEWLKNIYSNNIIPDDENVERILEWSNQLDFDKYLDEWMTIGTSTTSDLIL